MSGLLDKAKTASSTEEKNVKAEVKPVKKLSDGLLTKAEPVPQKTKPTKAIQDGSDGPDIPMILNLSGWVIIVLGAIFSLQGGGFGLIVVLVVLHVLCRRLLRILALLCVLTIAKIGWLH